MIADGSRGLQAVTTKPVTPGAHPRLVLIRNRLPELSLGSRS